MIRAIYDVKLTLFRTKIIRKKKEKDVPRDLTNLDYWI
jgi:hypothetical protein